MNNKLKELIKNPLLIFVYLNNKKILVLPDKLYLKIRYRAIFKRKLDLDNPKSFNEKLQWLKLYDRKDIYTDMVDKYEVKKYVASKIGNEYIIPTLGIYNNFEEIDFENLPNQFVIKCTHDSGSTYICKDKSKLKIDEIRKNINKALRNNFYYNGREWPYKNVKPRIIIEEYLEDLNNEQIRDYKFFIFNNKLAFSFIVSERNVNTKITFFDKNKQYINITQCGDKNDSSLKMPKQYDKMVELAEILSEGTIQVRVDFYVIKDKIYFGELTFFDTSGFGVFNPDEWDYKFGNLLELPNGKGEKCNSE